MMLLIQYDQKRQLRFLLLKWCVKVSKIQSSRAASSLVIPGIQGFHLISHFPWWKLAGTRPSRTGSSFLLHLVRSTRIFIPLPGCWCSGSLPACSCCRRGGCTGCSPQTQLCWEFANVDTRDINMKWDTFKEGGKEGARGEAVEM